MRTASLFLCFILITSTLHAQFGPQQTISTLAGCEKIIVVDVDDDEHPDIVVSTYQSGFTGEFILFRNPNGNGQFDPPESIDQFTGATSVVNLDIDNDGDQDLLGYSEVLERVRVYFNDGNGHFTYNGDQVHTKIPPVVADLDGDGYQDLVALNELFINTGVPGQFTKYIYTPFELNGLDLKLSEASDLDGDNKPDLLVTRSNWDSITVSWIPNLSDDSLQFGDEIFLETVYSAQSLFGLSDMHISDLDDDGDMDILLGEPVHDFIYLMRNMGSGEFEEKETVSDFANYPSDILTRDIDNDGDPDIVSGLLNETGLWYLNDGSGNFTYGGHLDLNMNGCRSVALGDINNDGFQDVASVSYLSYSEGQIAWNSNIFGEAEISGQTYLDANQNGLFDNGEIILQGIPVGLMPDYLFATNTIDGSFEFTVLPGNYSLLILPPDNWNPTTPSEVDVEIIDDQSSTVVNFGLFPDDGLLNMEVNLTSSATRCGFQVPFWLSVENSGYEFASGKVQLEIDGNTSLLFSNPVPDQVLGSTLIWQYDSLPPTHSLPIQLQLQMPGVDLLGEMLQFQADVTVTDEDGEVLFSNSESYDPVLNCAYDPNDKLVRPDDGTFENITALGSPLQYTVRFQNTGTDTAFTVRIEDQLDEHLDWQNFRPLAASHPFSVTLDEQGLISYVFEDILLPDSSTNEPGSHGFLSFSIEQLHDLPLGTVIENSAAIYFDFNPPILTNTTRNTLSIIDAVDDRDGPVPGCTVYPVPTRQYVTLDCTQAGMNRRHVQVFNHYGQLLQSLEARPNDQTLQIDLSGLPSGVYVICMRSDGRETWKKVIVMK